MPLKTPQPLPLRISKHLPPKKELDTPETLTDLLTRHERLSRKPTLHQPNDRLQARPRKRFLLHPAEIMDRALPPPRHQARASGTAVPDTLTVVGAIQARVHPPQPPRTGSKMLLLPASPAHNGYTQNPMKVAV